MNRLIPIALSLIAASAPAQSGPCFTNAVPNGDFESAFPLWFVTGPAVSGFPSFATNGVTASRCLELTPQWSSYSVQQPTPFALSANQTYEASIEVETNSSLVLDFGIVENGQRTRLFRRAAAGHTRLSQRFTPPKDANYTIDLAFSSAGGRNAVHHFDDVSIRPNPIALNLLGARTAGSTSVLRVQGTDNAIYAFQLSPTLSTLPFSLRGWSGSFWLQNPLLGFSGGLDPNGELSLALPFPASLAGVPLYWQAAEVPPPGAGDAGFGCPVMIAMPQ